MLFHLEIDVEKRGKFEGFSIDLFIYAFHKGKKSNLIKLENEFSRRKILIASDLDKSLKDFSLIN